MQLGSRDYNSQCYCVITNGCDGSDCYGSVAGSFSAIIAFSALTLLVGVRKSIWPAKIEQWGAGLVICLERDADCLHMVQLMPLPSDSCLI